MHRILFIVCLLNVAAFSSLALAEDDFEILPGDFELRGPLARQRVLVQEAEEGQYKQQINETVELSTGDAQIAKIENGVVVPVGDGATDIIVKRGAETKTVKVTVSGIANPRPWGFRHDVLPVFSKIGCNSGACHGALAGKGGFRLTLRGYNPVEDYHTIVEEAKGRRIELDNPGLSLVLAKPTAALPHKGGLRFETDSDEYRIISAWIAAGAARPQATDPVVTKIEMLPASVQLQKGAKQNFIVRAYFSDGEIRDVTRWAKFTSTNEPVAQVSEDGTVEVVGHGGGAISAWYSSKIAIARITSPYPNSVAPEIFADAPRRNFIDHLVLEQLQKLNLPPSPRCSDDAFIRRAFLDTIGMLPTPEEIEAFLADTSADKRDRLIDNLLTRPEFVDFWSYQWSDVLLINGTRLRPDAVKAFYQWVRQRVADNTPWDQFVKQILVAQGSTLENGATNFYALHQDPENMAENASQAFLGLSIACAKCHNHPLEKWTNDQYYAFANLFSRVRAKGWGGDGRNGDGNRTVYLASSGELIQPTKGIPQPPTPLDGEPLDFNDDGDRRIHLANWLVSPGNPYFSRSITNRIWAKFFGVGLVEQPDDMRISNPASNDALLSAASNYLVENHFDLKALMRVILQSETYQRASEPMPGSEEDQRYYSRYFPKRLMAEILLDAVSQVTQVPTDFNQISFPGADNQKTDFYPKGTRAMQLYDSAVASYFLKAFGRNDREITCECQRSNEPTMVQVLHLSNGDTLNQKLAAPDNRVGKLLAANLSDNQLIDQVYLLTISRYPTEAERQDLLNVFADQKPEDKRLVVEDLFWGLMSSREFLFNH